MTFNSGGTLAEFDTAGTNSSASPGESIALGSWRNTGNRTYGFKEENVTYESSGNLSALAVATSNITLASTMNNFAGALILNFYSCNVAQCPGPLVAGPIVLLASGVRF
jgi:hypothetical protein